ncbi:MAG: hypothetical protein WCK15_04170, partial [Pirellula sp.]
MGERAHAVFEYPVFEYPVFEYPVFEYPVFEYPVENDSRRTVLTAETLMIDPIFTALHQATLLASHLMIAE